MFWKQKFWIESGIYPRRVYSNFYGILDFKNALFYGLITRLSAKIKHL